MDAAQDPRLDSLKTLGHVIYGLYAVSLFVGITGIVAIVLNYIKRDDARGTWLESHFRWQIRTFWFSLMWGFIGMLTSWIGIGIIVFIAAGIWAIYRIVKGMLNFYDNKPMYLDA